MVDKQKIGREEFIKRAEKINGNRYDYNLVEYINHKIKVKIICRKHGEFLQLPGLHIHQKQGCPKCYGLDRTTGEFIEISNKIHNDIYDYSLVNYINALTKVKIICENHGVFEQTPTNHINQKNGCPKCYGFNKTTDEFIVESKKIHGDFYNYDKTIYIKAKEKSIITCPKHGDFEQEPTHHLGGKGCPTCNFSKGELKILKYILDNKINYNSQHTFNDCLSERLLPFDFYLLDYNLCIEYDGIQHFKPVKYFGGEDAFQKRLKMDKIKNQYCENNNINLIRIPYTDIENIKNILDVVLSIQEAKFSI